jgi:hypothetical protein
MAGNYNIHNFNDDEYYYCPNNECPCNGSSNHRGNDEYDYDKHNLAASGDYEHYCCGFCGSFYNPYDEPICDYCGGPANFSDSYDNFKSLFPDTLDDLTKHYDEIPNPESPTPDTSNEVADELASSITELSDEEITNLVESIDVSSLTEESISAVFSEEVLNELSDDQVTELIDAIVPSELSDDQALALSEALTDAPDSVKQEFEQQIDVFDGQFDTYVPTGSAVPVGARRVVVAAAVAAFAMPAPSSSSRKQ